MPVEPDQKIKKKPAVGKRFVSDSEGLGNELIAVSGSMGKFHGSLLRL